MVDAAIATVATSLAIRSALAVLDPIVAVGMGLAALGLLADAVRAGVPLRWGIVGGATFVAAAPHADPSGPAVVAVLGVVGAIVLRHRSGAAALCAAAALATGRPDGALALLVALETPRPRRFLAIAGLGVVAMLLAGPPALAVAPWRCAPQRLGAAIPLAPLALGVYGLHQAARPPEMAPAVLGRVGPLGAGIVVAWLGTYLPPPPPLYNLPAGIAMWGLSAAGLGVALRLVRHGAPPPLRMALALGIGAGLVAGLSPTPGSDAASCASWLASPTVLWLLATGLIRLAGPTAELSGARLVDGLLLLQVVWQAGFVPR